MTTVFLVFVKFIMDKRDFIKTDNTDYVGAATIICFREVYHTKRMQRVVAVKWSLDNKFILSASEEMNLRVWKANASAKLGVVCLPKEFIDVLW